MVIRRGRRGRACSDMVLDVLDEAGKAGVAGVRDEVMGECEEKKVRYELPGSPERPTGEPEVPVGVLGVLAGAPGVPEVPCVPCVALLPGTGRVVAFRPDRFRFAPGV